MDTDRKEEKKRRMGKRMWLGKYLKKETDKEPGRCYGGRIRVAAGVMAAVIACGGIGYQAIAADTKKLKTEAADDRETETVSQDTSGETENGFSEEGTTQMQTDSQYVAFSAEAVTMSVEEVYVQAGSTVEEGDALLKLTDESVADALSYYEEAVADAKDALYSAQLAFESGMLTAESELAGALLTADGAEECYEASLSDLAISVTEAEQEYNDAVAEIWDYQDAIDNGTYYVQAGIDEKQSAVDSAQASLVAAQEALTAAQGTCETAKAAMTADLENLKAQIAAGASYEELAALTEQTAADYAAVQMASEALTQSQSAASAAEGEVQKAAQSQESAVKDYNSKVETANQKIAELTERLEELEEKCNQAKREATLRQPELEQQYEEAVLEGKYANTTYETSLARLQSAVDEAEDTLEALEEEQSALLSLEDGIICADRAGTVAAVSYEAEDVLYEEAALVSYYDTDTILISVEVSQEEIADLAVGDAVEVVIAVGRNGTKEGEISSIATEKTSGQSLSNVTYTVLVAVDNADGSLSAGASATVWFDNGNEEEAGGTN